jgi:hypothetical protein
VFSDRIERFGQKPEVKLCVVGSIQRIQRRSKISRFWRIYGVKLRVFAKNTEKNGAFLATTWYSRKFVYVG